MEDRASNPVGNSPPFVKPKYENEVCGTCDQSDVPRALPRNQRVTYDLYIGDLKLDGPIWTTKAERVVFKGILEPQLQP